MSENGTACINTPIVKEQPQFTLALDAINKQSESILDLATSIIEKLQGPAQDKDSCSPCRMGYIGYIDRIDDKLNRARETLVTINDLL